MMNIELYIERIEQYETGAMTASGRSDFEKELAENSELQEALALYRQANDAIEQNIENNLRTQLQGWASNDARASAAETRPAGRVVSMGTVWMRWAMAAGVALLIGWFGFQWAGNQYSDQALYASYYEKPADSAFRAGDSETHPLQPGFDALQGGKYADAMVFFSDIRPDNDRYAEAQYYFGHAAVQLKQYDTAIGAFRRCAERNETKFSEKAQWNQLLVYVAAGRTNDPEFKALLEIMTLSEENSFNSQAKALQGKLGSVWRNIAR
jgi:tetratricopeptide (TPR) repeat protein